jgi:hypothetical protein
MSRDPWLKQLRIAGADTRSVEEVLAGDVPADGLQAAVQFCASNAPISSPRSLIG